MTNLGHVVFYVRDLERSVAFYRDIVGLTETGRVFAGRAAVMTGGSTHHELLLIQVGDAPGPLQGRRIGLYHTGWKIGESMADLQTVYARINASDYELDGMSDHTVSKSLYLSDPDGNEVELYIDDPDYDWTTDHSWMEQPVKPLSL